MGMPKPVATGPTPPERQAKVSQTTEEFDEYTAPARLDEHGRPIPRSKGLRAANLPPPPPGPQEPLTKASLAKGILPVPDTMPPAVRPVPPLPPPPAMEKVEATEAFEEYRRPGLDDAPRPLGLRQDPAKAKDILRQWKEPVPEVITPKRFTMQPVAPAPVPDEIARPQVVHDAAGLGVHGQGEASLPEVPEEQGMRLGPASAPAPASHSGGATPAGLAAADPGLAHLEAAPMAPVRAPIAAIAVQAPAPAPSGVGGHTPAAQAQPAHAATATAPPGPPAAARTSGQSHAAPPAPAAHAHPSGLPAGSGSGIRLAIVQARFNEDVTDAMAEAARSRAMALGCAVVAHQRVAGVFETPLAALQLADRADVDAVVVVGCVIQGQTGHDEVITHAVAKAVLDVSLSTRKPVGFGVTGPRMTQEQAVERIGNAAHAVDAVVGVLRAVL